MKPIIRFLAIFMASAALLSGCANLGLSKGGAEMAQVPITDRPSGEIYPGKFVWHDLLTADVQAAGAFYEKLFGWRIEYRDKYAIVRNGDKLIAGILQVKPADDKASAGIWIPSVSVADVDAAASLVEEQGGKVVNGPVNMEKRGRAALIRDPQGAYLVLLRAEGGDPVDKKAAIGDWLWNEIWTHTPDNTEAFYASLLEYDHVASENDYDVFMNKEKWRAGIRHLQDEKQPTVWVPVVRVADPEATAKRVTALGGVVWIAPDDAPNKGETALIGDATGALLLIQRWPAQASKGGN
jgi:predicted enzyme related to lactoylglutathione lyase